MLQVWLEKFLWALHFPPQKLVTIEILISWLELKLTVAPILPNPIYKLSQPLLSSIKSSFIGAYPKSAGLKLVVLSLCSLVDAALYCPSVWVNNNCLMNWATLTTKASPPLSLAVRCGCGLLQSVEILSVCTANQRSACSRDVVLLSRQPPTFLSQFWSSLVSAPCLFISLSPFCMCFYQRCCLNAVFFSLFKFQLAFILRPNRF